MKEDILKNWFGGHFRIGCGKRGSFYTKFRFDNGDALPPEHIQEYTVNDLGDRRSRPRGDGRHGADAQGDEGRPGVTGGEMAGAIGYYRAEFGHTLPLSAEPFQAARVGDFKAQGYASLISGKFHEPETGAR